MKQNTMRRCRTKLFPVVFKIKLRRKSEVYDILRCEGIIRMDGFVCGDEVIMLEVNTTPGMTANSFIPKMVRAMGGNLKDILTEIIEDKLV